ncbi:hypothetical protein GPA10_17755 [Streptomyces sp. p1417]|uniref:Uncharacterized protein n=1 Tax=Streptomyces typhae TaxID=2681492 RepID=A0A6L6WYM0_9ACTN|nr:hypothetical protein [Streptomyces typhae]MVO86557.1 hypothetical protein [Streptomyces typhae]
MTGADPTAARADELARIYRAHLVACPRRHVGLLADCVTGVRLKRALLAARTAEREAALCAM